MIETFTHNPQPPQFIILTQYYAGSKGQEPMHLLDGQKIRNGRQPLGTDQPAGSCTGVRREKFTQILKY